MLCRVDINAPLDKESGALRDTTRLKGCAPTVAGARREGRQARAPGASGRRSRVPQLCLHRAPRQGHERARGAARRLHRRRLRAGRPRGRRGPGQRRDPAAGQRALLRRGAHPLRDEAAALARGPGEDAARAQAGAARRPLRLRRLRRRAPLAAVAGRAGAGAALGDGPPLRARVREPRPSARGSGAALRLRARRHQDTGGLPDDGRRPGGRRRRHGPHRRPGRQRHARRQGRRHRRALHGVHPCEPAGEVRGGVGGHPRRARRQGRAARRPRPREGRGPSRGRRRRPARRRAARGHRPPDGG